MSLVVASPMKLVADLDALSKSLDLPMPLGQSFLPTLTSGISPGGVQVERATLDRFDPTQPLAVVWLVAGANLPVDWCAALAFKSHQLAWDALQTLGAGVGQRDGIYQRKLPSGDVVWAAVRDRELLVSGTAQALLAGGSLAIAAQATPMLGQALLTINPSLMAKSTGQSLDQLAASALALFMAEMDKDPSGKRLTPASKRMTEALAGSLIRALTQVAVARISLEMGAERALVLRAEVQPMPGSNLAAEAAQVSPYAFDSGLPVRSDASAAVAWGDMASWLGPWMQILEASGATGRAAARDLKALVGESLNGGSCTLDLVAVPITSLCSLTVRPGVAPSLAIDRYLAFIRSSNVWEAELDGRKPSVLKIKRVGKVTEIEKSIEGRDPQVRAVMKALLGGDVVHSALAVKQDRVVAAIGPKPRELLDRYGKGQPAAGRAGSPPASPAAADHRARPSEASGEAGQVGGRRAWEPSQGSHINDAPILKRSLLDTAGAGVLGFVDVMAVLGKVAAASKEVAGQQLGVMLAALPGLNELRAPVVLSASTGNAPAIELQIPFGSLQNVARVVSGFMGQMGAK